MLASLYESSKGCYLESDLQKQGVVVKSARYNASEAALLQASLSKSEGVLSQTGALVVNTGKYTGRSPEDKHIVLILIPRTISGGRAIARCRPFHLSALSPIC